MTVSPSVTLTEGLRMTAEWFETSTVTGNRELPRVMVIVPWKKSEPGELRGKPLGSLLDEALSPVNREVFRRRLDLYEDLHAEVDVHEAQGKED